VRRLIPLGIVAGLLIAFAAALPASACSELGWTGQCQVVNSGEEVTVSAEDERSTAGAGGGPTAPATRPPVPTMPLEPTNPMPCDAPTARCERPNLPAEPADAGFPDITLADLVSFRPSTPVIDGEPAGFGVVGMPTNFVATASVHVIPGTLLGYPVAVRFTPTAFVFAYGDGKTLRSASGGVSWEASGSPQFAPTDTSHVYRERGTYMSSATIEYAAAVDFGAGWRAVAGVVTARSADYPVQVVEARTALVDRTCLENPRGPGC
jgi:hypothetical protein